MSKSHALLSIVILSFLSGCASYGVAVDSICSEQPFVNGKYVILPGNKDTKDTDLIFKEFSKYVDRALFARGFRRVDPPEEPDMVIVLCYGISTPQQYEESVPVYGYTNTHSPCYGVTGYRTEYYLMSSRFIQLTAYEARTFSEATGHVQVWNTTITSTGSRDDLRLVFPVMIAAAEPYFGTNTGKKVYVRIWETDPRVAEVKGSTQ